MIEVIWGTLSAVLVAASAGLLGVGAVLGLRSAARSWKRELTRIRRILTLKAWWRERAARRADGRRARERARIAGAHEHYLKTRLAHQEARRHQRNVEAAGWQRAFELAGGEPEVLEGEIDYDEPFSPHVKPVRFKRIVDPDTGELLGHVDMKHLDDLTRGKYTKRDVEAILDSAGYPLAANAVDLPEIQAYKRGYDLTYPEPTLTDWRRAELEAVLVRAGFQRYELDYPGGKERAKRLEAEERRRAAAKSQTFTKKTRS